MTKQELIDRFNDGDTSFLKYFSNDAGLFVKFLGKREYIDELNFEDLGNYETVYNDALLGIKDLDYVLFVEKILDSLSDLSSENGKFYLIVDAEDLSSMYCNGRNTMPLDSIEKILSGDWLDYNFYDTDKDDWDLTIRSLDKENLSVLYNKIFSALKDVRVAPETDTLEFMAQSQGHPDYVHVTEANVILMLKDQDTKELLFDEYLSDLKRELFDVYRFASESSYHNAVYDEVWSALKTVFSNHEFITKKYGNKNKEFIKLEFINFNSIIEDVLRNGGYSIDYFGSFSSLFKSESSDCFDTNPEIYSYPSDEEINSYFRDNIY